MATILSSGGKQMLFNAHILPTIPIDPSASEVLIYLPLRLEEVSAATFPQVNGFFVKNGKLLRKRLKGEGEEILSSVSVKWVCFPHFSSFVDSVSKIWPIIQISKENIFVAEVYTPCFLLFVSVKLSGEQFTALLLCTVVFLFRDGLQQFWIWLESLRGEGEGRSILITAHNGGAFDFPILMVTFNSHTNVFVLCMTPGQHDQPWG